MVCGHNVAVARFHKTTTPPAMATGNNDIGTDAIGESSLPPAWITESLLHSTEELTGQADAEELLVAFQKLLEVVWKDEVR